MISSNGIHLGFKALLAALALGGGAVGCSGMDDMHDGNSRGTSEVRGGIETGREGIRIARVGLASFRAGDHIAGRERMGEGMAMVSEGMDGMHDGFDRMSGMMMSGGMMEQCSCDGGQMMSPMHQAMTDMQRGHDMMADDDPTNDQTGAEKMAGGMDALEAGYDAADQAMSCMDDAQGGGMPSGGMM